MTKINENLNLNIKIELNHSNKRIDKFLSEYFTDYSRSFLKNLLINGNIKNNNKTAKPSTILKLNDIININLIKEKENFSNKILNNSENYKIKIIEKNNDFLIIEKPAGLVVHAPNKNYTEPTLSDWVIQNYSEISTIGCIDRPGIVHRLDKETSGLMIIARTNLAHSIFTEKFKTHAIKKTYLAFVAGHPELNGEINKPIFRHPVLRNKMHCSENLSNKAARNAITNYKIIKDFENYSLVEIKPITGRTHQIRVHFYFIGHPLLGDTLYGKNSKLIKRHALHASNLEFEFLGKNYKFESKLPIDMENLILK